MKKAVIALLVIVVVLLVGGGLAAFLFLGTIVKKGVETVGPNITKTSLKLDSATISVFNGSGQLKGFELGNPEGFKTGSAVKVGSIGLALEPRSVLGKKVVIHSIRVEAPEITYEAALGGSNIGKILDNLKSTSSQEKSTGGSKQTGSQKALQVDEVAKMVAKDAAKIGQEVGEKAKDVGTGLQDRLKKEGSSVSDLFKSKTK
jgi:hypothetical protein